MNRASFLVDRFRAPLRVDSQFCCPTQFWRFQRSNVISTSATRCWCSYAAQSHRVVQILFGFLFCSPDCRSPLVFLPMLLGADFASVLSEEGWIPTSSAEPEVLDLLPVHLSCLSDGFSTLWTLRPKAFVLSSALGISLF